VAAAETSSSPLPSTKPKGSVWQKIKKLVFVTGPGCASAQAHAQMSYDDPGSEADPTPYAGDVVHTAV